jgi:GTP-binding protein
MADIPGLIEGAHEGVGLGHDFLKHVERTRMLIHVVDVSGLEGRDPMEDFHIINEELKKYNEELSKRPQIVAANKIDVADKNNVDNFIKQLEDLGYKVFPISAATGTGIKELMNHVHEQVKALPEPVVYESEISEVIYKVEDEEPFTVEIEDDVFVVKGPWLDHLLRGINFADRESLQYFQRALRRKGVIQALEDKGIKDGDTVCIGDDMEFEYTP